MQLEVSCNKVGNKTERTIGNITNVRKGVSPRTRADMKRFYRKLDINEQSVKKKIKGRELREK